MEAWRFETQVSNFLIESARELIDDYNTTNNFPPGFPAVVRRIKTIGGSKIDASEDFNEDEKGLAKRILDRWLSAIRDEDHGSAPTINFGGFKEGTQCKWPGDCVAKSPNPEEMDFVRRYHQILILRDLFSIQSDHILANRWGGAELIPICALHNRQKNDAMWPTIIINRELI
jgi:hypothetical protein